MEIGTIDFWLHKIALLIVHHKERLVWRDKMACLWREKQGRIYTFHKILYMEFANIFLKVTRYNFLKFQEILFSLNLWYFYYYNIWWLIKLHFKSTKSILFCKQIFILFYYIEQHLSTIIAFTNIIKYFILFWTKKGSDSSLSFMKLSTN